MRKFATCHTVAKCGTLGHIEREILRWQARNGFTAKHSA